MNLIKFPESFEKRPHPVIDGVQYAYPSFSSCDISIVFGSRFYSDGIETYEMFDFIEDEPRGYLTIDQINEYLKTRIV